MVDLAVLRVRNSIETERHDSCRACPRIFRHWQRNFLILELNEPYSGLFKVPRAAMQQAIEALR
jgi:hypothetical protein